MTIERDDEAGIWRAVCDGCGDSLWLETESDDRDDAAAELEELGWTARPTVVVKFPGGGSAYRETYAEHDCPDCV